MTRLAILTSVLVCTLALNLRIRAEVNQGEGVVPMNNMDNVVDPPIQEEVLEDNGDGIARVDELVPPRVPEGYVKRPNYKAMQMVVDGAVLMDQSIGDFQHYWETAPATDWGPICRATQNYLEIGLEGTTGLSMNHIRWLGYGFSGALSLAEYAFPNVRQLTATDLALYGVAGVGYATVGAGYVLSGAAYLTYQAFTHIGPNVVPAVAYTCEHGPAVVHAAWDMFKDVGAKLMMRPREVFGVLVQCSYRSKNKALLGFIESCSPENPHAGVCKLKPELVTACVDLVNDEKLLGNLRADMEALDPADFSEETWRILFEDPAAQYAEKIAAEKALIPGFLAKGLGPEA